MVHEEEEEDTVMFASFILKVSGLAVVDCLVLKTMAFVFSLFRISLFFENQSLQRKFLISKLRYPNVYTL